MPRALALAGDRDRLETGMHAKGAKEMADVIPDCLRAEVELLSDLLGRASLFQEAEYLGLTGRQSRVRR